MKLESSASPQERARWKIVRTDDYTDVPGNILSADELSGEYCLTVGGEIKTGSFGHHGMRIVGRRR